MLRYKAETRPGLVALYNIWPGNGAGLFLQPRSLHGANNNDTCLTPGRASHVRFASNPSQNDNQPYNTQENTYKQHT